LLEWAELGCKLAALSRQIVLNCRPKLWPDELATVSLPQWPSPQALQLNFDHFYILGRSWKAAGEPCSLLARRLSPDTQKVGKKARRLDKGSTNTGGPSRLECDGGR